MKSISFLLRSLFLVSIIISSPYARIDTTIETDMTLIHGGNNIILHDDNTWDFEDRNAPDIREPFNITLYDNRIIWISPDYTWRFVDKKELSKKEFIIVKTVTAKGTATHLVLSEATAIAMKSAVNKATKKLKASIKNRKLNFNKLLDCVRRVEKDEDTEEKFTKGKGWSVSTTIILDKGSILAVLDCEEEKKEAKKEGKKEGKPKK